MIEETFATSEAWSRYFRRNRDNLMPVNWEDSYLLTDAEVRTIAGSLRQFQLGESSEGNHLIRLAERYAATRGDIQFPEALKLFIQEEQRHARDLGHFLEKQNIPLAHKDRVDTIFRFLRHQATLELSVMAMLTAEIIAVPYYKALHDATQSPLLKRICRQILRDEIQHLRFQIDTLGKLRRGRSPLDRMVVGSFQRILLTGALLIVWKQHRPVLMAGGFTFGKFWQTSWGRNNGLLANKGTVQPLRNGEKEHLA